MKTSIALCTYNGEAFLQEQLDSYLSQIQQPNELIVFDDCSSDNTIQLLNDFKSKAPFLVEIVQNQKQIGPAQNFLNCLQKTSGELIFFSDQDDIWHQDKISKFKIAFEQDEALKFAFSNANLINDEGQVTQHNYLSTIDFSRKWNSQQDLNQSMLKNHGFVNGFLQVLKGSFRDKINLFRSENPQYKTGFGHDHVIAALAGLWYNHNQTRLVDEELVSYRQHDDQAIGAKQSMLGKEKLNDLVKKKKESKTIHFDSYLTYLNYYLELLSLAAPNEKIIDDVNEAIQLFEKRKSKTNASSIKKIIFAYQSLLTGKYNRYSQYPFKEFIRDLL